MSTMTTEFAAPVSRTQMNFSLSIVRLVKEMHCGLTPVLVSDTTSLTVTGGVAMVD